MTATPTVQAAPVRDADLVASFPRAGRLPKIEHIEGLPPGATAVPVPLPTLVADLLRMQLAGYPQALPAPRPVNFAARYEADAWTRWGRPLQEDPQMAREREMAKRGIRVGSWMEVRND